MQMPIAQELTIKLLGDPMAIKVVLSITAMTADAQAWIGAEAPRFGRLFAQTINPFDEVPLNPVEFNLWLYDTYNPAEVIAYLMQGYEA